MYCVCICMYICMYNYVYLCKTSCICPVGRISVLVCIVAHNDCWCISVQAEPAPPLPQFLSCASILFYNYLFPEKKPCTDKCKPRKEDDACMYILLHTYVCAAISSEIFDEHRIMEHPKGIMYICMYVCTFAVL